jgi:hypothetical protein
MEAEAALTTLQKYAEQSNSEIQLKQLNVYSSTLRSERLQKANAQTQSSVYNYFNTCNDD